MPCPPDARGFQKLLKAVAGTAILLLVWGSSTQAQQPPTPVHADKVRLEEVQQRRRVTGTLKALSRAPIAALEEGKVVKVHVREGDTVKTDDILATLDDRRLKAELNQLHATRKASEAIVDQRRAELERMQADMARAKVLFERKTITESEWDRRQTEVAVAEALSLAADRKLLEIDSQIELVQIRLDDTTIEAPFDGKIVERSAEPGQWVHPGDAVVTLVSTGKVEAWLEVPERYMEFLRQPGGSDLEALLETGRRAGALQVKWIPEVHPRARTFQLVLTLDDQQGALTPGMSVNSWVPVGESRRELTIHRDAIIRGGGQAFVYKATPNGEGGYVAVKVPVSIDFEGGSRVAIHSPSLSDGDLVVVEGNERLIPGSPLAVQTRPESVALREKDLE